MGTRRYMLLELSWGVAQEKMSEGVPAPLIGPPFSALGQWGCKHVEMRETKDTFDKHLSP